MFNVKQRFIVASYKNVPQSACSSKHVQSLKTDITGCNKTQPNYQQVTVNALNYHLCFLWSDSSLTSLRLYQGSIIIDNCSQSRNGYRMNRDDLLRKKFFRNRIIVCKLRTRTYITSPKSDFKLAFTEDHL